MHIPLLQEEAVPSVSLGEVILAHLPYGASVTVFVVSLLELPFWVYVSHLQLISLDSECKAKPAAELEKQREHSNKKSYGNC